jgi:phosphoribosylformimino-5-aminoimidazole carboxamide ribotide isomerase
MMIYPAIDLLDGKCVRLKKGDFEQKTVYSDHPATLAQTFAEAGAKALHLVDLSGAKDPTQRQFSLIRNLVAQSSLRVQCGGGIRSLADVKALLDCGVERAVIGSIAATNVELTRQILQEFGAERITLAIDVVPQAHEYLIAINGWKTTTPLRAIDLIRDYLTTSKIDRILCTDISLDGMMIGPNIRLYQELIQLFPTIDFQASGGITVAHDVNQLAQVGVRSLVIGKAIYEGTIDLKEMLRGSHAH